MTTFKIAANAPFLRTRAKARKGNPNAPVANVAQLTAKEERALRQLAMAVWVERQIDDGTFVNYADAARMLGVSRARVSQLLRTLAIESPIIETITKLCG